MNGAAHPGASVRPALSRRAEGLLLLLVLLAAAALRLHRLGEVPLRIDEISTAFIARLPAGTILEHWGGMPLLFLLTKASVLAFPGKGAMFLPPLLEGLAGVAAVWLLGRVLSGPATGLLAAALASAHPMAVYYSQDARYYALLMLCSALASVCLVRGLERGGRWWWLHGGLTLLNLLNHAAAWLVLAGQGLTTFLLVLAEARREGKGIREVLRRLRAPVLASLAAAGVYLLLFLAPLLAQEGGAFWGRKFQAGGVEAAAGAALVTNPERFGELAATFGGTGCAAVNLLLSAGVLAVACLDRRHAAWLAGTVLLPLAALTAAGARKWEVRYLIFMLPLFLVLLAEGWRRLALRAPIPGAGRARPLLLASPALILPALFAGNLASYYAQPKQAWAMAAGLLEGEAARGDVVIVGGPREAEGLLYYLRDEVNPRLTRDTLPFRFTHTGYVLDRERPGLAPVRVEEVRRRREGGASVWRLWWMLDNPRRTQAITASLRKVLDRGGVLVPFRGTRIDLVWAVEAPPGSPSRLARWGELAARARSLAPGDGGLDLLQAELLLAGGDRAGGARRLEAAAREADTSPGLLARAFLEALAGRDREAAELIRRARAADPFELQAALAAEGRALVPEAGRFLFPGREGP